MTIWLDNSLLCVHVCVWVAGSVLCPTALTAHSGQNRAVPSAWRTDLLWGLGASMFGAGGRRIRSLQSPLSILANARAAESVPKTIPRAKPKPEVAGRGVAHLPPPGRLLLLSSPISRPKFQRNPECPTFLPSAHCWAPFPGPLRGRHPHTHLGAASRPRCPSLT